MSHREQNKHFFFFVSVVSFLKLVVHMTRVKLLIQART